MAVLPSASYSLTVRLQITNRPGIRRDRIIRDLRVNAWGSEHGEEIVSRLRKVPGSCCTSAGRSRSTTRSRSAPATTSPWPTRLAWRASVVVTGVGAAGTATIKTLQASGARDIVGVDELGMIHKTCTQGIDFMKRCFPGFFRGLLDSRARTVNDGMKLAAACATVGCVSRSELGEGYIIPSVFNNNVAAAVAEEVARAADATGVARRRRRRCHDLTAAP